MNLPKATPQYDATNEAQTRSVIEREDARNLKKGGNILVGKGALVLTAPNGSLWQITVSNAGVVSATAFTLP
ncbi:MAG: hypothetical protein KGO48_12990 [Alphaproteobacteria bacterium]|nr:hypothetical protein [Alphaproteobacteria bacterium]